MANVKSITITIITYYYYIYIIIYDVRVSTN
jgi:hypothetical protein